MATIGRILPKRKTLLDGTASAIVNSFSNKYSLIMPKVPMQKINSELRVKSPVLLSSSSITSISKVSSLSASSSISSVPSVRSFHTSPVHGSDQENEETKKIRKIVHFQNPLQWLRVWADFKELNNTWDANIDRNGFVKGAKMAVSRISQIISQNSYSELRGLLSRAEYKRLQGELEKTWSDVERRHVGMEMEDIHNVIVTRLRRQQIVEHKYVDVDVYFLCLKEVGGSSEPPILIKIFARFHREYTDGRLPDWIVTKFNVKFDSKFAGTG